MSEFFDSPTHPKARKPHQCIACGAAIPKDERYTQQTGFCDGSAFRNRYHNECWSELDDHESVYFCTGDIDPPTRLRQLRQDGA